MTEETQADEGTNQTESTESVSETSELGAALENLGLDSKSYEGAMKGETSEAQAEPEGSEVDPQAILDKLEVPKEDQPKAESLLEVAFRDGTEKFDLSKPEDVTRLKEGYLRQKDYTVKTQELSTQRQAFEQERTQYDQEYIQKVNQLTDSVEQYEKMRYFLAQLQETNPEKFDDINNEYLEFERQSSNPTVKALTNKLSELESKMSTMGQEREHEQIRSQFSSDLKASQGLIDDMAKLGIIVDPEKVKEAYANGAKDVPTAIGALYSKELLKLTASAKKTEEAKKIAASKSGVPTAGTAKNSSGVSRLDFKGKRWHDVEEMIQKGYLTA